jgi:cell division septal protein FtsQ
MTVLFNIKVIKIEGSSEYDASEIVKASQIYKGDNLVRLNTDTARNRILTNLMYIDDVTIKKEFPSTVVIETVASVPAMDIQNDDEYIVVSEGLKKLSTSTEPRTDLLQVIGFEPSTIDSDTKLTSEDEQKVKILETIYNALKDCDMLSSVVSVDISDKYDILIDYADRIYIKLGSYSDLEYKVKYSNTVITQNISEQKSGYLIFVNSNSASFVEKDEYDKYTEKLETLSEDIGDVTEDTTETTDTDVTTVSLDEMASVSTTYEVTTQATTSVSVYSNNENDGNVDIVYGWN